jgi:hypothetical protein
VRGMLGFAPLAFGTGAKNMNFFLFFFRLLFSHRESNRPEPPRNWCTQGTLSLRRLQRAEERKSSPFVDPFFEKKGLSLKMESQRGKKKKKKKPKKKIVLATSSLIGVVGASCRGCHIAHQDFPVNWPVFGFERLDREAFGLGEHDEVPDMTMDEDGVLTVLNASSTRRKSFYISTSCPCFDAAGMPLAQADFVDSEGKKGKCATLILTLAPLSALAVCRVEGSDLFSHVSELPEEQSKADAIPHRLGFPLSGEGPFLCSQSEGGQLSHFGVQRFAVDLECPLGTLVVAVGDGQVLEVRDSETCRGPHAENLFHWNSIMLQLAGGPVVE